MDVKLIMFRADGSRRSFNINPGATSIGRKTDCDIRIPLVEVSRRHAEIVFEDENGLDGFFILRGFATSAPPMAPISTIDAFRKKTSSRAIN